MKSAIVAVVGFSMLGIVAVFGLMSWARLAAPEPPPCTVDVPEEVIDNDRPDHEPIGPRLDTSLANGRTYKVKCASMDGGAVTDLMVPFDGGTAGIRVNANSIYVAPDESSTINVHVGFATQQTSAALTQSLGFIVGTTGRDGVGVSMDAKGASCISAGAIQEVDVITGKQ